MRNEVELVLSGTWLETSKRATDLTSSKTMSTHNRNLNREKVP